MKRQTVEYYGQDVILWRYKGNSHRDGDLPAEYVIVNGEPFSIAYYNFHQLHRTNGPAIINYDKKIKRYYYHNKHYNSLEEMLMMETCR